MRTTSLPKQYHVEIKNQAAFNDFLMKSIDIDAGDYKKSFKSGRTR